MMSEHKFKRVTILFFVSLLFSFSGCISNDYKPEYQKDRVYDGCLRAVDTINMKTYTVLYVDGQPHKKDLSTEITKWYDVNGYHSMTKSIAYLYGGNRITTEKISRDKHSLPVARDILIESENTEPVVTLMRLKQRRNGKEEWLFRHYLDPQKYLEDASVVIYEGNSKVTKKKDVKSDSLVIREIDIFDNNGRIVSQSPGDYEHDLPFVNTYYNSKGYVDSLVAKYYERNDITKQISKHYTEKYTYDFDDLGNQTIRYTHRGDTLIYITEYSYGIR